MSCPAASRNQAAGQSNGKQENAFGAHVGKVQVELFCKAAKGSDLRCMEIAPVQPCSR